MSAKLIRTLFLLVVLAMLGLLAAGCYTVLVHPQVQTTGEETFPRMCSDCHASSDYYYWHFPYQHNWYSRYDWSRRYYYDPWWWDNYWWWDDDGGGGGTKAPAGHLWQPRVAPDAQPNIAPGTSGNVRDTNKSSDKGSGQSGDQKEKPKTEGSLWQPRVPPQNPEPAKPATPSEQPEPDDSSGKKSEDKVEEQQ